MNTSTGDSDNGRFGEGGFWREMVLVGNVRDTQFSREIFSKKCGFRRGKVSAGISMDRLNMCVDVGGKPPKRLYIISLQWKSGNQTGTISEFCVSVSEERIVFRNAFLFQNFDSHRPLCGVCHRNSIIATS